MKRKHLRLVSLIAAFGMLALVLSLFVKQPVQSAQLKVEDTQSRQTICAGVSSSLYLAEVKPRFSGVATGNTVHATVNNVVCPQKLICFVALNTPSTINVSPPLWLLNRSLLI